MNEKWADIAGYEDAYQVSDMMRVKSLSREVISPNGTRVIRERIIKASCCRSYYPMVLLHKDGVRETKRVHLLMCEAFLPRPKSDVYLIFIDGDKHNISLANFGWAMKHDVKNCAVHSVHFGENNPHSKLTENDVVYIRKSTKKNADLAREFGVCWSTIYDVKEKISWKHVVNIF